MTTVMMQCILCGEETPVTLSAKDARRIGERSRFTCKFHSVAAFSRAPHDSDQIVDHSEPQVREAIEELQNEKSEEGGTQPDRC